jgi:hypothetical protein
MGSAITMVLIGPDNKKDVCWSRMIKRNALVLCRTCTEAVRDTNDVDAMRMAVGIVNARTVIDAIQEMARRGDQFFTVMKTSRSTLFDSANDDPEDHSDDSDGTSDHSLYFIDVDVPLVFEEEHSNSP